MAQEAAIIRQFTPPPLLPPPLVAVVLLLTHGQIIMRHWERGERGVLIMHSFCSQIMRGEKRKEAHLSLG